jgi:hypothetical protein
MARSRLQALAVFQVDGTRVQITMKLIQLFFPGCATPGPGGLERRGPSKARKVPRPANLCQARKAGRGPSAAEEARARQLSWRTAAWRWISSATPASVRIAVPSWKQHPPGVPRGTTYHDLAARIQQQSGRGGPSTRRVFALCTTTLHLAYEHPPPSRCAMVPPKAFLPTLCLPIPSKQRRPILCFHASQGCLH